MKPMPRFLLFMLLFAASRLWAADIDKEFEEASWAEGNVQLPAFPLEENLIPFRVGSVTDTGYFIDGSTISIGADEVIRYSLVIISSSGAKNISYEGMRCLTAEKRVYAFGRADKTWAKAKSDRWRPVRGGDNNHNVELYANYFCAIGAKTVMTPEDARRVLRYGGGL